MKKTCIGAVIIVLVFLSLCFGGLQHECRKQDKAILQLKADSTMLSDSISKLLDFSEDNLNSLVEYYNFKYKDEVVAQIILETGHLTSAIYKSNNNMFGMKHPVVRPTTSEKDSIGYAYYANWIESLKDYKIYQIIYNKNTFGEFISYTKYSEDSLYLKKIYAIVSDRTRKKN